MKPNIQIRQLLSIALFSFFMIFTMDTHSLLSALESETQEAKKAAPLGSITIDTDKMSFSVPGTIIRTEAPLEFLAVTKGGNKSYESLIELETDAIKFNTACLLIGLDPKKAEAAKFHFDPKAASGDAVSIVVSWESKGKTKAVKAASLLAVDGVETVDHTWIYTGSTFDQNGNYLAQTDGTLVGFVHDPASVIEHRIGLGLNNYGAVAANAAVCPSIKTRVVLTITKTEKQTSSH